MIGKNKEKKPSEKISRKAGAKRGRRVKQLRYLSQSIRLEESVAPRVVKISIFFVFLALVAFIFWASVTYVDEIARVRGEIIPKGLPQIVQHLEGGIVQNIKIREGDIVDKGDILMTLKSVDTDRDMTRTRAKLLSLELRERRLDAQINEIVPDYDEYIDDLPEKVTEQMDMYEAAVQSEQKEREVILDQIAQREENIQILENQLKTTRENLKIIQDLYEKRKKLEEQGIITEVRFMETKQRLIDLQGQIDGLKSRISAAQSALSEFRGRLSSLEAKNRDEDLKSLEKVKSELLQTREILGKLEDRSKRLNIRAPVRGIVKGLKINTVGSVIQPGEVLMEIVPLDQKLVALVRIPPDNIGYISVGDPVNLKVSTFDFSKFGSVKGKLEFISATTFSSEDGDSYYNGRISMEKNYVGDDKNNRILPGMTVIADINVGRKSVLEYLLKPIYSSLETSFSER